MRRNALLTAMLFGMTALAGCMHSSVSYDLLAKGDVALCKHCNCYMPAHLSAETACPACNCHQPAISCSTR